MGFITEGHEDSDVDASTLAQHHTLGNKHNQAAPGFKTRQDLDSLITTVANGITAKHPFQTANANPTSTTNVDITGLAVTIPVIPSDVFFVIFNADTIKNTTAGDACILELVVDGIARGFVAVRLLTAAMRVTAGRSYIITGLTAGDREFKIRTRLDIAGDYTVGNGFMNILKLNNLQTPLV